MWKHTGVAAAALILLFAMKSFAQAAPEVAAFAVVQPDTGEALQTTSSSSVTVDLAQVSGAFNIRALTSPLRVQKVVFSVNDAVVSADTSDPYALYSKDGNRYQRWSPAPGVYRITALPYDSTTKLPGVPRTLQLTVIDNSEGPPAPTPSPTPSPTPAAPSISLPVFPRAAGFGTETAAGSGRHLTPPKTAVFRVTSLDDAGPGTLRECIESDEPRVCIFEISGRINLARDLRISAPFITVAGQTAPAPGILISGATFQIAAHDILIQHLQIRVGDSPLGPSPSSRDGIAVNAGLRPVFNVVLDHLSISWAIDENVSVTYPNLNDITVSNSLIAEALYGSIHPKGPHSMGMLLGSSAERVTLHHNLFAKNFDRNPKVEPGVHLELVSNVVYGWGGRSGWNCVNLSDTRQTNNPVLLTAVGNYFKPAPFSPISYSVFASPPAAGTLVYSLSNIGPGRAKDSGDEWAIIALSQQHRAISPPFPMSNVLPTRGAQTLGHVLRHAGSRPRQQNQVDARIKREVSTGTGEIKDCVLGCQRAAGGFPEMTIHRRTLHLPEDPQGDADGDGYTNLEEWLHAAAAAVE